MAREVKIVWFSRSYNVSAETNEAEQKIAALLNAEWIIVSSGGGPQDSAFFGYVILQRG